MKKLIVICSIIAVLILSGCISSPRYGIFDFDCAEGKHDELKCADALRTHTYNLPELVKVTSISGELLTGPRKISKFVYVIVEVSVDKKTWVELDDLHIHTGTTYISFTVDGNNTPAQHLRFRVYQEVAWIGGSRGMIAYEKW